jgi:hypothetical protein
MAVGFWIPGPNHKPRHFLYAKKMKDSMLAHMSGPRIILIGGSNLSLGIDSKKIQDSLDLRPINTATHAALGLMYMMDNTLRFVKEGDVVLVAPEYDHFYGDFAYGGYELLITTVDIDRSTLNLLTAKQWMNLYQYFPKFTITKLNPMKYRYKKQSPLYYETSFNEFGDVTLHWDSKPTPVLPLKIKGDMNERVFEALKSFEANVIRRKAKMYVTFPGFQESSFNVNKQKIDEVEAMYRKMNFKVLGTAADYKINDSLMFDTPYHLSKEGAKIRTERVISQLRVKIARNR